MSKVDDELTRRLRRAERPVEGDGLFEGLERRRSHRERLRKVQAGMLAFAVLAATTGGFIALRSAFDPEGRDVGDSPSPVALSSNGEIVFVRESPDGRSHVFAAQPDGSSVRQITDNATNDTDPAVSPDGKTIAFSHELEQGVQVIATIPVEGGVVTWQTSQRWHDDQPAWSPDGARIAFISTALDSNGIYLVGLNQGKREGVFDGGTRYWTGNPSWAPDGSRIVFVIRDWAGASQGDLATINADGTDLLTLLASDHDETAAAWSPDGSRIAFLRQGDDGDEIRTIAPDGTAERLIATASDSTLESNVVWAPDGSALLVSDGKWIYRVDASPGGDPRHNLVQLMEGNSPSWQPLPAGSEPSPTPTPEPSISPDPEPSGHDIGLGFRLCHLHPLGGLDLLGDGPVNKAWTGSRVSADGRCSDEPDPRYGVAVDLTGDGLADAWSGETIEFCFMCRPFAGVDLDADGGDELAVMTSEGSMPTFAIYTATVDGGEPRVIPILTAEPGHPSGGHVAGRPLTFTTGGDAGFSGSVRCENFPEAPVLVTTWSEHPIEGDTKTVHETKLVLGAEGAFHVVDSSDYEAPVSATIPGMSEATACGVDWELWD